MSLGFRTDHLLMLSTELRSQSYDSMRGGQFYREVLRRAATVPGVKSVALSALRSVRLRSRTAPSCR